MTSFGWKRKTGSGVVRKASEAFEKESKDEELDNEVTRGEVDWLTLVPKKRLISLEDAKAKSQRLRDEGATLAQSERYWEAIKKWDEGLLMVPTDSRMLEMKAQALMSVGEVFPAVQTAQQAVNAEPTWWEAHQTLGRAQLNMGEVQLAVQSFSKAVMLSPADKELWEDDLRWACLVRNRCRNSANSNPNETVKRVLATGTTVESGACGPCDNSVKAASSAQSSSVTDRTGSATRDDAAGSLVYSDREQRDSEVRQSLLRVPPNYVHLRG